ncbi:MAG: hypothetical protein HUJ25_10195 [Crocinitomicaceae bacterium]|nr:hypothetical protein [Crocinitomicaceae bacterium]
MRITIIIVSVLLLVSCKKKEREGNYTGVEDLYITSSTDTISSTFNQSASVVFKSGGICKYTSTTNSFEFSRSDKTKTGYDHTVSGGNFIFQLEFKTDSLIAYYYRDLNGEQTTRSFRGSK